MKFESINRRFTEVVAEWMAKGYTINTATMGGSQGEIAKIDLTDGKELIRVLLGNILRASEKIGNRYYHLEGVELIVGRVTDTTTPHSSDTWHSVWNNRLAVITTERYFAIGTPHRNGEQWYGTMREATAQQDKFDVRYNVRHVPARQELCERAKEIVLPYVRRQPKCKSVKLSEIGSVIKYTDSRTGKNSYYVKVRGQELRLK